MRGTDYIIEAILSALTEEQFKDTHWVHGEHERRMEAWHQANDISNFQSGDSATYPMFRFFQENKTECFELDCNGDKFEMFESMRIYIERDGRPYNYLSSVDDLNKNREEHLTVEEDTWREHVKKQ